MSQCRTKYCSSCGSSKETGMFNRDISKGDNLSIRCKSCNRDRCKARRLRIKTQEAVRG